MDDSANTIQEKNHFDDLAETRRKVGFIPDLRRMGDNDYFYLSPYRRQALANLSLRIISDFAVKNLQSVLPAGATVLDLGCGNGWFALELARAGFCVTAVDLSDGNIAAAQEALNGADLSPGHGSIRYSQGDLNTWEPGTDQLYDAACFNGSLHHLPDPAHALGRALNWLKPTSWIIAAEPTPESYRKNEALIACALRLALSCAGAWHDPIEPPKTPQALEELVEATRLEYVNWADTKEQGSQSPNNNSSHGQNILRHLAHAFSVVEKSPLNLIQHRLIGGTRFPSEEDAVDFARNWIAIEKELIRLGSIVPGGYLYFGKRL